VVIRELGFGAGVAVVAAGTATTAAVSGKASLSAILTFVGVILVALMTAYFTKRRQDESLAAARDRQQDALDAETQRQQLSLDAESARQRQAFEAERDRLDRQLRHERELHDLSEIRKVIDEALQNAELVKNTFLDLGRLSKREKYEESTHALVYSQLQDQKRPLLYSFVRLTARGQTDLAAALTEFYRQLATPSTHSGTPLEMRREKWNKAENLLADQHARVIDSARRLAASQLPT
jgi:hypothetical protein